ncbi:DUF3152 domain-containing protein [Streptomyces boninensis]|uniref:DUF3152 domain-containing protein n=1 Tax=Streptomyces boninensis TaxID=2039455 RepID=UPI003B20CB18
MPMLSRTRWTWAVPLAVGGSLVLVIVSADVPARGDTGAGRGDAESVRGDTGSLAAAPRAARPGTRGLSGRMAPRLDTMVYEFKIRRRYPLPADREGTGRFARVSGALAASRASVRGDGGPEVRYRVEVEEGLPLDGRLFADAAHRTLNDPRGWGGGAAEPYRFRPVTSGPVDFVLTLAGPDTTAELCAMSGLDTTEDNVSCDSAETDRVVINAYRWAQGADTFGGDIRGYRQMVINHEVGHRLGHDHVGCAAAGALAPVMMQQTKSLSTEGVGCLPNPWPYQIS